MQRVDWVETGMPPWNDPSAFFWRALGSTWLFVAAFGVLDGVHLIDAVWGVLGLGALFVYGASGLRRKQDEDEGDLPHIEVSLTVDDATLLVRRTEACVPPELFEVPLDDITGLAVDGDDGDEYAEFGVWRREGGDTWIGSVRGADEARRVAGEMERALGLPWLSPGGGPRLCAPGHTE